MANPDGNKTSGLKVNEQTTSPNSVPKTFEPQSENEDDKAANSEQAIILSNQQRIEAEERMVNEQLSVEQLEDYLSSLQITIYQNNRRHVIQQRQNQLALDQENQRHAAQRRRLEWAIKREDECHLIDQRVLEASFTTAQIRISERLRVPPAEIPEDQLERYGAFRCNEQFDYQQQLEDVMNAGYSGPEDLVPVAKYRKNHQEFLIGKTSLGSQLVYKQNWN